MHEEIQLQYRMWYGSSSHKLLEGRWRSKSQSCPLIWKDRTQCAPTGRTSAASFKVASAGTVLAVPVWHHGLGSSTTVELASCNSINWSTASCQWRQWAFPACTFTDKTDNKVMLAVSLFLLHIILAVYISTSKGLCRHQHDQVGFGGGEQTSPNWQIWAIKVRPWTRLDVCIVG